jgi:aminopeptidase YwaD
MAYVRQFGAGFNDLLCAINVDGVGLLTENTTLTMLAHSEAFEAVVRAVHARYPRVVWVDPWVQSNHSTYALHGVPSIALSSLTWDRAHQADDTVEWISPEKLDESIALVTDIVQAAQGYPATWSRP